MPFLLRQLFFACLIWFIAGCATAPYRPGKPAGVYHIVGSGQNLYRISKAYGVDMHEIMRANNIQNPNQIGVGEKLFIPKVSVQVPVEQVRAVSFEPVEEIVGPKQYRVHWKTITIHHSGTFEGNAEAFDRNHRMRHMGGLFYHFVIGNGTSSGDGEIEVGWRWRRQSEVERKRDIQICLVGNFDKENISAKQFAALVGLVRVLQKEYNISDSNIRVHKKVTAKATDCPGINFPYLRLKQELKKS